MVGLNLLHALIPLLALTLVRSAGPGLIVLVLLSGVIAIWFIERGRRRADQGVHVVSTRYVERGTSYNVPEPIAPATDPESEPRPEGFPPGHPGFPDPDTDDDVV